MPALVIGGTEVPVKAPLVIEDLVLEPLQRTDDDGNARTAAHGDTTRAVRIPVQTERLTTSEKDALEAVILAPGTVAVSGDRVPSGTVCVAIPQGLQPVPLADQWVLTFELLEVGA
jgi:hypothetical protein